MSATLTAPVRLAAAKATLELPFRIPNKDWFTLRECGAVLGLSESTAEVLYDRGELTGHSHNAATGQRKAKRVLRLALVAYAIRTADYSDESLTDALIGCLPHLPVPALIRISTQGHRLAWEKSLSRPAVMPANVARCATPAALSTDSKANQVPVGPGGNLSGDD
jgi:hypothetical protein